MLPHAHFVFGLLFAGLIFLIMPSIGLIGLLLIILASVMIDFDHYIYYVVKKRDLSLIKAYGWFRAKSHRFDILPLSEKLKVYRAFCCFHGLEVPILFFILTFLVSEYFGFIFIGATFHLLLDYYEQWHLGERKDKISVISDFLKFRKLKYLE